MATILEAQDVRTILWAVEASHEAVRSMVERESPRLLGSMSVWINRELWKTRLKASRT